MSTMTEHGDREEDKTHSPTLTSLFFTPSVIADPRKGGKCGWRGEAGVEAAAASWRGERGEREGGEGIIKRVR